MARPTVTERDITPRTLEEVVRDLRQSAESGDCDRSTSALMLDAANRLDDYDVLRQSQARIYSDDENSR